MRILAEQAAGGDMARLDKMFETGELHTATYLPTVLRLMKEESDKLMPHYRTTLPYWQSQSKNQGERWMREFAEGGAESGITRFWHVMATIKRETIDLAPKLGKAFETISWGFSNMLLIPTEFRRWAYRGEEEISNFFQRTFGDFDLTQFKETQEALSRAKDTIKEVSELIATSFGGDLLARVIATMDMVIYEISTLVNVMGLTATRQFSEAAEVLDRYGWYKRARLDAEAAGHRKGGDGYNEFVSQRMEVYDSDKSSGDGEEEKPVSRREEAYKSFTSSFYKKFTPEEEAKLNTSWLWRVLNPIGFEGKVREIERRRYVESLGELDGSVDAGETLEKHLNEKFGIDPNWKPTDFPLDDPSQVDGIQKGASIRTDHEAKVTININSVGTTREQAQLITDHVRRELDVWSDSERKAVAYNIAGVMA